MLKPSEAYFLVHYLEDQIPGELKSSYDDWKSDPTKSLESYWRDEAQDLAKALQYANWAIGLTLYFQKNAKDWETLKTIAKRLLND